MMVAAAVAVLVAMCLTLLRAVLGPSLYDRVLAGNSFGTKTVLLLGLMGYISGRPDFLDIALLYALINFVGTIAILKFFRYQKMSPQMSDQRDNVDTVALSEQAHMVESVLDQFTDKTGGRS